MIVVHIWEVVRGKERKIGNECGMEVCRGGGV